MSFPLSAPPVSLGSVACGVAGTVAAIYVIAKLARPSQLDAIPTVGSSTWLGSWVAGFRFLTNGVDIIQEGYEKHKPAAFKVRDKYDWLVVISNREHIEEVRKAPDDELSHVAAVVERFSAPYTLGSEFFDGPYRVAVARGQLTRNIGIMQSEIREEMQTAFDEVLDLSGNEWKSVPILPAIQKVVCRTSNRVIVGLPLCRNPEWIDLTVHHTINSATAAVIVGLLPKFIRPLAASLFMAVSRDARRAVRLLGPIIEQRRKHWDDKPNDYLSWFLDETKDTQMTVKRLAVNMLLVNMASIFTTSASFAITLLYLAANPRYIQPLREEVETIVEKEGWSKTAISKMCKIDSFIKECQRIDGGGVLSMARMALKDFTFSDGTFVPKGTMISVAARCIQLDEKVYENANAFEPFRFADMQESGGEGGKYQFVSTSPEFQHFGHGRHACPGRFFAANEMKTMLAHVVTNYDIKLEDGTTRPPSLRFGAVTYPNPSAKILLRRRKD